MRIKDKIKVLVHPGYGENQYARDTYIKISSIPNVHAISLSKVSNVFNTGDLFYDYVVVHWLENALVNKKNRVSLITITRYFIKFFILKLVAKKVIYVRHNVYPHSLSGLSAKVARYLTDFCEYLSYKSVVLSKHLEGGRRYYIPHPLYKLDKQPIKESVDKYYIVFGRIVEYKAIDQLLALWEDHKLLIAGKVDSDDYLAELQKIIKTRSLSNVKVDGRFIPDSEASLLVSNSLGLIVNHNEEDMIVSSSFFFAASLGVLVFAVKTPFFISIKQHTNYSGLVLFDSIEELVTGLNGDLDIATSKEQILNEAESLFGDNKVIEAWEKIFQSDSELDNSLI